MTYINRPILTHEMEKDLTYALGIHLLDVEFDAVGQPNEYMDFDTGRLRNKYTTRQVMVHSMSFELSDPRELMQIVKDRAEPGSTVYIFPDFDNDTIYWQPRNPTKVGIRQYIRLLFPRQIDITVLKSADSVPILMLWIEALQKLSGMMEHIESHDPHMVQMYSTHVMKIMQP